MKHLFISLTLVILTACHSPMNYRVKAQNTGEQKLKLYGDFKNIDLKVSYEWVAGPFPETSSPSILFVIVKDLHGNLVDLPKDYQLSFYSSMPSMGHPMDDAGQFEQMSTGLYINRSIRFNMGGEWLHELWLVDKNLIIKDRLQWQESL